MEIYTLNEQDERTHGVKVHECFPDTINSIALSQDANTSLGTIGVGFKYRYFSTIGKEFESNLKFSSYILFWCICNLLWYAVCVRMFFFLSILHRF